MSTADVFEQVFHLTTNGWIRGDSPDRPAQAIETWHERLTQASMHAATFSRKTMLWADSSYTQEDRDAIRAKYPEPFDGNSPSPWAGYVRPSRAKEPSVKSPSAHPEFDFDKT